jgi:hypothetical protein
VHEFLLTLLPSNTPLPHIGQDPSGFLRAISDGSILCRALNTLFQTEGRLYDKPSRAYMAMDNLRRFCLECTSKLGMAESDLFEPVEVYRCSSVGEKQVRNHFFFVSLGRSRSIFADCG